MKKIYGYLVLFVVAFLGNVSINHAQIQIDCPNPLDLHIANDISGSVDSREHLQSKDFITQLGLSVPLGTGANESRIGISQWSSTIQGLGDFVEYTFPGAGATFTTSQADIISYVNSARPFRGNTDVYTALLRSYEWVKQDRAGIRTGTPVIVLLTDAFCYQISNNISSLATQIKNEGIIIQVLAIDAAVNCTALQGTNVASPGGYFSAADYATLQSDALFYITSLISNSCGTPPFTPVPDLTVSLSSFQITGCDTTTPVADVDYTVTNLGRGDFSGTLDVSFYNGDPTLPSTQYLFTESSSQSLTAFGGSTSPLNSTNAALVDTGELYAVVNIDGSLPANAVPLSANFTGVSLTDTTEENTANNTSSAITRADAGTCLPYAIIQTSVTNSGQICDNEAIYYVEVCNIGTADAGIQDIVPYPDPLFVLVNGPVLVGNDPFIGTTLPQGECVIYEYTYNLDNAVASTFYDFSVAIVEAPSIPGNATCAGATISATSCASVAGATPNDDAGTVDGIEYDWTGAATSGMANTSTTRALVDIGGQCWMRYNMDNIPSTFNPPPTWSNFVDNGFSGYYTGGPFPNEGRLYQWSAAMNGSTTERAQGICPTGWHVPSRCEYMYLDNSLGMSIADQQAFSFNRNSGSVGNKLKATTGTNSSGFSALFTGWRSSGGAYQNRGTRSYFWMSTERSAANARYIQLRNNEVGVGSFSNFKSMAMPVRCLKD